MKKRIGAIVLAVALIAVVSGYSLVSLPSISVNPSGNRANVIQAIEATFTIHHVSPSLNKNLLYEGFAASGCGHSFAPSSFWTLNGLTTYFSNLPSCVDGWTYSIDPTVTITNEGHDFIQGKLYGVTKSTTLVTTDYAVILGISTSATAVAVTDNFAAAGPCDSASIYNTGGSGAQPAAATTPTAGTPSAGSVATTLAITYSITATISSAQAACMLTEVAGGAHPYIFGEVAFGPDSFVSGDSLTVTYTMTSA